MARDGDDYLSLMEELVGIVRKLRGPTGCSWDRQQTVESLAPFMLEEAYEVTDAAVAGDMQQLKTEMGDLLLHVVMSTEICREKGIFDLADVISGISQKLVRRHPHVFDENSGSLTPDEVEKQWESIKATEKRDEGFFGSMPPSLPALQTAWRIQQRASEVGFDWPDALGAREKIFEELQEFQEALESKGKDSQEDELGDLLFSIVNYCRLLGFQPESALRRSNGKFIERFSAMEDILRESGLRLEDADMETMDGAWEQAKDLLR